MYFFVTLALEILEYAMYTPVSQATQALNYIFLFHSCEKGCIFFDNLFVKSNNCYKFAIAKDKKLTNQQNYSEKHYYYTKHYYSAT